MTAWWSDYILSGSSRARHSERVQGSNEEDISAEEAQGEEEARVPEPELDARGQEGAGEAAREGQEAPDNAIGAPLEREKLGRDRRIGSGEEIGETLRTGRAVRSEFFSLRYRLGEGPPRVAFLAGRKVGRATRRNRARRVLREAFRTSHVDVGGIAALVFIATESAATADYHEVKRSVAAALRRAADQAG